MVFLGCFGLYKITVIVLVKSYIPRRPNWDWDLTSIALKKEKKK